MATYNTRYIIESLASRCLPAQFSQVRCAFLLTSWLTVALAFIPALYEGLIAWKNVGNLSEVQVHEDIALAERRDPPDPEPRRVFRVVDLWDSKLRGSDDYKNETPDSSIWIKPGFVANVIQILGVLCDVQIITGLGLMIAGFEKLRQGTLTFYHQSLVMSYWSLALNSFWASRMQYLDRDIDKHKSSSIVRRLVILVQCILAVVFQFIIFFMQLGPDEGPGGRWDPEDGAFCYKYKDGSSPLPWNVGLLIFCLAMTLSLRHETRGILDKWEDFCLTYLLPKLFNHYRRSQTTQRERSGLKQLVRHYALKIIALIPITLHWLIYQWLSIWSYGGGFYPFT